MMKRKIALDVGDVRIGVAVSDLLGITANPRETYVRKKGDTNADIAYFCEYAKREEADAFVLGLPKNMDGTEGDRAVVTRQFGDMLQEASGLPVLYQDERLTTKSVREELFAGGGASRLEKGRVDSCSAVIILEEWMEENPA